MSHFIGRKSKYQVFWNEDSFLLYTNYKGVLMPIAIGILTLSQAKAIYLSF